VGVPGRLVERPTDEAQRRRAHTAERIGFDAYGATRDTPDPVAHAVNCMLDHIHLLDQRLEAMSAELERHGITGHFDHLPDLEALEIHSTADDNQPQRSGMDRRGPVREGSSAKGEGPGG
jgi:serine O-acetyltransferase